MILITGSSSGLGAALAKQYANTSSSRQRLMITGRSSQRLAELAKNCRRIPLAKPVIYVTRTP